MNIKLLDWNDHKLAGYIRDNDLSHNNDVDNDVCYWFNDDYSIELLVIFNNNKPDRKIYRSIEQCAF